MLIYLIHFCFLLIFRFAATVAGSRPGEGHKTYSKSLNQGFLLGEFTQTHQSSRYSSVIRQVSGPSTVLMNLMVRAVSSTELLLVLCVALNILKCCPELREDCRWLLPWLLTLAAAAVTLLPYLQQ